MGIFQRIASAVSGPKDYSAEVSQILPLSECSYTCDASECHSKYPSSMKMDEAIMAEPLWESTSPYGMHMLVSTGKTDWQRDALDGEESKDSILPKIGSWGKSNSKLLGGSTIKVTVSSFELPLESDRIMEYKEGKIVDVLLLPFFVWCKGLTAENYDQTLTEIVAKLVELRESGQGEDQIPKELYGCQIEVDYNHSYVFLCSHRTRDKKCGITAPIMKKEFDLHLRDLDMYRDFGDDRKGGVKVGFVNHIGGHKFAANVMVYNRTGENAWFAKCSPLNVKPIIEETILNGKVWPNEVRIVQKFNPISW